MRKELLSKMGDRDMDQAREEAESQARTQLQVRAVCRHAYIA